MTVFADIDGVLSMAPPEELARDVRRLEALGANVALVLCSGRTRPELEHLSQELGIRHPFICEHGAAAFVPTGYFPIDIANAIPVPGYDVMEFGRSAALVVETVRRLAARYGVAVQLFSDLSVDEVAQQCGMPVLTARLAKLRDYGEMFRVLDPGLEVRARMLDALRGAHLRCVTGAPFDHAGAPVDISIGVGMLRTLYRRVYGPTVTVGIADWQADGDLLQLVECPVMVESLNGALRARPWRRSAARGEEPAGALNWAESIVAIVRDQYPAVTPMAAR